MITKHPLKLTFTLVTLLIIGCSKKDSYIPPTHTEPQIIVVKAVDTLTNEPGQNIQDSCYFIAPSGIKTIAIKIEGYKNGMPVTTQTTKQSADLDNGILYKYKFSYTAQADTVNRDTKYTFTLTDRANRITTNTYTVTTLAMDATTYILTGGVSKKWIINSLGSNFNLTDYKVNDTFTFKIDIKGYTNSN